MDDSEKVRILLAAIDEALAANTKSNGAPRNAAVAGALEAAKQDIA